MTTIPPHLHRFAWYEPHLRFLARDPAGKRADLGDADLGDADLSGADLSRANLTGADISGADLTGANFIGADLRGADLTDAILTGADLTDTILTGADLSRANLSRADLTGADLTGADLSGANLSDANLSGADLRGADLADTDLSGADLIDAILVGSNRPEGFSPETPRAPVKPPTPSKAGSDAPETWGGLRIEFDATSGSDGDTVSMALAPLVGLLVRLETYAWPGHDPDSVEVIIHGIEQEHVAPYRVSLRVQRVYGSSIDPSGPHWSIHFNRIARIIVQ